MSHAFQDAALLFHPLVSSVVNSMLQQESPPPPPPQCERHLSKRIWGISHNASFFPGNRLVWAMKDAPNSMVTVVFHMINHGEAMLEACP